MVDAPSSSQDALCLRQPANEGDGGAGEEDLPDELADLQLDGEAQALLEELSSSQAEVQQMLAQHRQEAEELGGMKTNLANELHELQEETWKLQLYGELEVLRRQLASLQTLEQDMDAAEAVLNATEPGAAQARSTALVTRPPGTPDKFGSSDGSGLLGRHQEEEEDEEEDLDPDAITAMQTQLDEELAEMFAQLQAVKAEAAAVSAHKAMLEAELRKLLESQQEDSLEESTGEMVEHAES